MKAIYSILYKGILSIIIYILWFGTASFANTPGGKDGRITGKVFDKDSKHPVEYATVSISDIDGKLVTGTVTNSSGLFSLENINYGTYNVTISFLGYDDTIIERVVVSNEQKHIDLSDLFIAPTTTKLEEVSIVSDAAPVQYQIDKKIINVSQQFSTISGSAIDVLQNIPSVRVDIEGNVSLRGSSGFTVLIDGRPTLLEPNDVLRQMPASNIQNIELITNPSAKYDPDGSAGIINIITKKKKMKGISGIANLNVGLDDKYGGDFLFNLRVNGFNFFLGADYNHRYFPRYNESDQRTTSNDTTYYVTLDGEDQGGFEFKSLRSGVEWDVTENDFLSIGYRIAEYRRKGTSRQNFSEWSEPGPEPMNNISIEDGFRGGSGSSITTNYKHNFPKKGHELIAFVDYRMRNGEEGSNNELYHADTIIEGTKNVEDGPARRMTAKIEYTLPLREEDRFEAGLQGRFSHFEDITGFSVYDHGIRDYVVQPAFEHTTLYDRSIISVYSLYAATLGKIGIQGGLRGEYNIREIDTDIDNNTYKINRFDLFPTLHTSYNLSEVWQAMASYSRRINRPRGYYFEPFLTWMDAYNVRKGNPNLVPEYTDSYELGILRTRDENFISFEGFYRVTHNKIERIRSVYSKDVFLHTVYNVGTDYALGGELAIRYKLVKWWETDLSGSFYNYRVEGELEGESFDQSSFNWDGRWNNTFTFTPTTQMQLNSHYRSASANAQGKTKGYIVFDASFKKSFFDRKLTSIIQVRDIFGTAKREFISEGSNFYYYRYHYHKAPVVMLTLTFNFNNYKMKRPTEDSSGGNGGEGEGF